jgi:signal transduction histidine kinase/ActR/RegA family two-component response regulator
VCFLLFFLLFSVGTPVPQPNRGQISGSQAGRGPVLYSRQGHDASTIGSSAQCSRKKHSHVDLRVAPEQAAKQETMRTKKKKPNSTNNTAAAARIPKDSLMKGSHQQHPSAARQHPNVVWMGRAIFGACLILVAGVLAGLAYWGVEMSHKTLTQTQYESIAERALKEAAAIASRKQGGTKTMATVVSQLAPDASAYPFVTVPGFERIAANVLNTSGNRELGFVPLVQEDQVDEFEAFAYNYFQERFGDDLVNHTENETEDQSILSTIGIWASAPMASSNNTSSTDERTKYYATTGTAYLDQEETQVSNYTFLTPILQHDRGVHPVLLYNIRSEPDRAQQIESMINCVQERATSQNLASACGAITDIVFLKGQPPGTGPGALVLEPIYPAQDPYTMTAILASPVVWEEILHNVFAATVNGIDCVLETSSGTFFSYRIKNGHPQRMGFGDFHSTRHDNFHRSVTINAGAYTKESPSYTLHLYPSDDLYKDYYGDTLNPMTAALGAVAIMVFTSIIFSCYDWCVRREFSSKQELMEARRRFVRYISHEVRNPLNTVCMGLALMQEQQATAAGFERADVMAQYIEEQTEVEAKQKQASKERQGNEDDDHESSLEQQQSPSFRGNHHHHHHHASIHKDNHEANVASDQKRLLQQQVNAKDIDSFLLIQDLLDNAQSSVDVLNGFLNYDKIESGSLKLDLSVVDIWSLVKNTAHEFQQAAHKKQFTYNIILEQDGEEGDIEEGTKPPTSMPKNTAVIGDHVRLRQVIRNLLSNSCKFTPHGGTLLVIVSYLPLGEHEKEREDEFTMHDVDDSDPCSFALKGYIQIQVQDTGAGMTQLQLDQLFSAGVQFNPNNLQAGQGSGLGLFIAKGIVEQHAGSLVATSQGIGHGSTFIITLPLYTVPDSTKDDSSSVLLPGDSNSTMDESTNETNHHSHHRQKRPPMSHRILIVDDTMSNRKMMKRLLEHHGHVCELAEDGKVAVKSVLEAQNSGHAFDTILMDYEMPVMNGPDSTEQIREGGCDAFIVGVTGNMFPEDTEKFLRSGTNAVLPKPFKIDELDSLWDEFNIHESDP